MRTNDDNELVSQMLHSSDIHVVHATPFFLKKSIPGLATQTLGLCCRACLAGKIQTWLLLNETDPDQSSIWAMSPTMSCVSASSARFKCAGSGCLSNSRVHAPNIEPKPTSTFPQNETLAVACWDNLVYGTLSGFQTSIAY